MFFNVRRWKSRRDTGNEGENPVTRRNITRIVTNLTIIPLSPGYCSTRTIILAGSVVPYPRLRIKKLPELKEAVQLNFSLKEKARELPSCNSRYSTIPCIYFACCRPLVIYLHRRSGTCLASATAYSRSVLLTDVSTTFPSRRFRPPRVSGNALVVGGSGLSTGVSFQFSACIRGKMRRVSRPSPLPPPVARGKLSGISTSLGDDVASHSR